MLRSRILGIDPGSEKSGYVILNTNTLRVEQAGISENDLILPLITSEQELSELAIEKPALQGQANVFAEIFDTSIWTGRFIERYLQRERQRYFPVTRRGVIKHVLGSVPKGRNADSMILLTLTDRLGGKGTKKEPGPTYGVSSHAWAALAVAVTVFDQHYQ